MWIKSSFNTELLCEYSCRVLAVEYLVKQWEYCRNLVAVMEYSQGFKNEHVRGGNQIDKIIRLIGGNKKK